MTELASQGQLRAAFIRWALVLVPGVELLGFLSGQIGGNAQDPWFVALEKPAIFPPPALFGIAWAILFALIALALTLVVTARGAPGRGIAIGAWVVQFLLILGWSPLFFGAHQITSAYYLLIVIDVAVLVTLILFWRVRPLAGMLLLPYLGWVLFATVLNYEFLKANPGADGVELPVAAERIEI
jgi:tryptophan-rich sensory protein